MDSIRSKAFLILGATCAVLLIASFATFQGLSRVESVTDQLLEGQYPQQRSIQEQFLALIEVTNAIQEAELLLYEDFALAKLQEVKASFDNAAIRFTMFNNALVWGSESETFMTMSNGEIYKEWKEQGYAHSLVVQPVREQDQQTIAETTVFFEAMLLRAREVFEIKELMLAVDARDAETLRLFDRKIAMLEREMKGFRVKVHDLMKELIVSIDENIVQDGENLSSAMTWLRGLTWVPVFAIILGLAISVWFIHKIVLVPILRLLDAVSEIASGNFSRKVVIDSSDEIGQLGSAFNAMTEEISRAHGSMEQKIEEKTQALTEQVDELEDTKKAVFNILEDVAQEKEKSESMANELQKFQLAIDNSSEQITIADTDGIVVYANPALEKITGHAVDEILGTSIGELWNPHMEKEQYEELWETVLTKKDAFVGEFVSKRKNGDLYDAHIMVSPILNKDEEAEFFVAVERDITKEKEVDRAKTEFVSLASHQLRTPLSTINWYSEMLIEGDAGELNEDQKMYIDEIYQGNQRMVDLVNSLLDVSRLELGTFTLDPEPVNIVATAELAIKELEHKIKDKEQTFTQEFDDIPEIVLDAKLIKMVLQNLLSNAVKYTPEKGSVGITMLIEGEEVVITVKDTGLGIPKDQHDSLFKKLFRADNVRKSDTEGTGLGLYLVKGIVEIFGGNIRFDSDEGKGTTFFVTVPLKGIEMKKETVEVK